MEKGGTPLADFPALLFVTLIFVIKYSRRWQPTIGGGKLAAPHLANKTVGGKNFIFRLSDRSPIKEVNIARIANAVQCRS